MIEPELIVGVFLLMAAIQLYYYLFIFSRIGWKKHQPATGKTGKYEAVSVIICVRNERQNLEQHLEKFLNQDHPDFQVVVVDDGSTDGTKSFLEDLQTRFTHLKVVTLEIDDRYHRGKKFALTMGIKAAKNPVILVSDADCYPNSDQWIKKMTKGLKQDKEIAIGVSMFPHATGLLSWIIRVETFHTAMQYLNLALAGMPYMGVGRNLAYRRDLFFKVKGFASHQHVMSGDDDLFVNETAYAGNVVTVWEKDAQTTSAPLAKFSDWYRQKLRHFSTGRYYKGRHKRTLGMYSFSLFLYYAAAVCLVVTGAPLLIPAIAFGVRLATQGIVMGVNLKKIQEMRLLRGYFLFDFILLYIQIFVGIRGYFFKPRVWK